MITEKSGAIKTEKHRVAEISNDSTKKEEIFTQGRIYPPPPHPHPNLLPFKRAIRQVPVSYLIISLMEEEKGI